MLNQARRLIVADTGPLVALAVADLLPQTLLHFGELLVPENVITECLVNLENPGAQIISELLSGASLIVIQDSKIASFDAAYSSGLGTGEIAVLAYASQYGHVALIDDERARKVALRIGVQTVRSGAIVVALKRAGLIESIKPALAAWSAHGYFLTDFVQKQLLVGAGEK